MIKIEVSSPQDIENASAEAYLRKAVLDRIIDNSQPMSIVVREYVGCLTQVYGPGIESKIVYDAMGHLHRAPKNCGDRFAYSPVLEKNVNFEIKSSYSSSKGTYRVTHTRAYENFDYFLLCLVDQDDGFKERFYMLPKDFIVNNPDLKLTSMNGNSGVNAFNKYIEKSRTVKKTFAYSYFGHYNLLKGTEYVNWIDYLNSILFVQEKKKSIINSIVDANTTYSFKVNGINIEEKSNIATIIKLANQIGGRNSLYIFPPNKISRIQTKVHRIKLNFGEFYIDPNFNISDIAIMMTNAKKIPNLNIEMI